MECLCTFSSQFNHFNKFKLRLLSSFHQVSDLHSINGKFCLGSICTSPKLLSFNKPRVGAFHLESHDFQDFRRSRSRRICPTLSLTNPDSDDGVLTSSDNFNKVAILSSIVTVVLAVANRVLYKLSLVSMKEYPFFLAQLNTFGYVIIYSSILYTRYKAGVVTDEMIGLPKSRFMIIGFLEAIAVVCGMSAAAMLPGPSIPLLNQTFLVWQLSFSFLLLGRKYSLNKLVGCLLVAAGVILAVQSGSNNNQMLSGIGFVWPLLMIASSAFQAGASILKESVFLDARSHLKGRSLDIFVVNSFGSAFQALFVLLFLPVLSKLGGIPFSQLPSYLKSGVGCFLNYGSNVTGCDGAPLLPLLYLFFNLCFNISVLRLVKISSAVVSTLAVTSSVPISIYILSLPLPYLPEGVHLSAFFQLGTIVLLIGLLLYNMPQTQKAKSEID